MYNLIGFKKFKSKKGKDYVVMYVSRKAFPFEKTNSEIFGCVVEEILLSDGIGDKLQASDVGKTVDVISYNRNGRTYITDIEVI